MAESGRAAKGNAMNTQITEHHTYIDGHKIAFREQGEGSPVILIHGIPTNSLMWRAIIPRLAKTHRVIAPDLAAESGVWNVAA